MRAVSPGLSLNQIINILNPRNKSLSYVLPLLGVSKTDVFLSEAGTPLVNGYLWNPEYEGNFYTLVFEQEVELLNYYAKKDNVYIFKIDDKYEEDFNLLKQSKYSHLSIETKNKILNYWELPTINRNYNNIIVDLSEVFSRAESRFVSLEKLLETKIPRTQEVTSALSEIKETWLSE